MQHFITDQTFVVKEIISAGVQFAVDCHSSFPHVGMDARGIGKSESGEIVYLTKNRVFVHRMTEDQFGPVPCWVLAGYRGCGIRFVFVTNVETRCVPSLHIEDLCPDCQRLGKETNETPPR